MRKFEKLRSKKGLLLLYVLFLALCVWLNFAWADFGEEGTSSVTYGLSNDSTVALEEGAQIRVDFTLLYDGFEGVNVKFEADSAFKEEQIRCCRYDSVTGELLAEDTVALK
ncbi:MAG: hypothetical protein LUF30_07600 [Lachnospiraceae bacterium]|nr:hypothetical protein [Lachnospiraceae bacterium]